MRYLLPLLPLLAASPVAAQPVLVRLGTHERFGRVVFELPKTASYSTERSGNAVVLHFPGAGDVPDVPGSARNIAAVTGGVDMATVTVAPGVRLRTLRMGSRVVIDVLDPVSKPAMPRVTPSRPDATSHAALAPLNPDEPVVPAKPTDAAISAPASAVVVPASTVATPASPKPAPPMPPTPSISAPAVAAPNATAPVSTLPETTLALAVTTAPAPPGINAHAAVLPFGPGVAAASFRHGQEAWIVFDDRRPLDLSDVGGDPTFAGSAVELLPSATLLRLKLPAGRAIRLRRRADGWSLISKDGTADAPVVLPVVKAGRLVFSLAAPGQVVVVPDTDTGRNLLVGTLKAVGPGVPVTFQVPEFAVEPSWQGIVVEPISDRTVLRAVPEGFAIETGSELSPSFDNGAALASATLLTRRFDFPTDPVPSLLRRLQAQVQDEGQAAPQSRLTARKAAAQTMLALGLGPEAESLLRLAVDEDPRAETDADLCGLAAVAALLSDRPQEAGGLDNPALSGSDEITLWRAVRLAMANAASPAAAQSFAVTAPLVLAYPRALQTRLLPLVAETMIAGGASPAADALLARLPAEPLLTFARAARLEQKGDTAGALTLYDALTAGRDRLVSARANTRAILLRLASGALAPGDAADALERSFGDWRGDTRERDLRLRTADLAAQAGKWRMAFGILKETAQLFPEDAARVGSKLTALLDELLHGPGASNIKPLDLVALAEENAAALAKADTADMMVLLADKLTALDLPQRAGPVIQQIASSLPPGPNRAALGARLAAMRLGEGDSAGAAGALAETDVADLPPEIQEQRGIVDARIHATAHDTAGAVALLATLGTPASDELRAKLLADNADWHGSASALADLAALTLPENGALSPEQQDLLLRLASAQSRAGDDAALLALGRRQAGRLSGARADMFHLLTSAPVTSVSELHRAAGEIALARAVPTTLAAVGTK